MEFTTRKILDVTLIKVLGRIDHNAAKDFENMLKPHLDQCIEGDPKKIIIDLNKNNGHIVGVLDCIITQTNEENTAPTTATLSVIDEPLRNILWWLVQEGKITISVVPEGRAFKIRILYKLFILFKR